MGRQLRRRGRIVRFVALGLLRLLMTAACTASPAATGPTWGLVGGYGGIDMGNLRQRGVQAVLVEMSWAQAEPTPGAFDNDYLDEIARTVSGYRALGFQVVALNYGLDTAPDWLLSKPDARNANQFGEAYTQELLADRVFATDLRGYAEKYTTVVLKLLGKQVSVVRVGGGHWGELDYPEDISSDDSAYAYWAFSQPAQQSSPVPGWRPCSPSPQGQAQRFLDWYLDALVDYQNWQVQSVRRNFSGTIAVLYPSVGLTSKNIQDAVADDLCGRDATEQQVARGFDHRRQIAGLTDRRVAVWSTWVDNQQAISELAGLDDRYGLQKMGENSGEDDAATMRLSVQAARRYGLSAFFWVRAEQAYCFCRGWATIDQYQRDISS